MPKKRLESRESCRAAEDTGSIPLPGEATLIDKILGEDPEPLLTDSLEEMEERNVNGFYEKTASKAFAGAMKEGEKRLGELVNASYYPEAGEEEISDYELMVRNMNLVK
jgi:hypothetical protein